MTNEWQPIETAPRDGSDFVAGSGNGKFVVIHYSPIYRQFVRSAVCRRCSGIRLDGLTHWIPLPPLPKR